MAKATYILRSKNTQLYLNRDGSGFTATSPNHAVELSLSQMETIKAFFDEAAYIRVD